MKLPILIREVHGEYTPLEIISICSFLDPLVPTILDPSFNIIFISWISAKLKSVENIALDPL